MGLQADAPRREADETARRSDFYFQPSSVKLANLALFVLFTSDFAFVITAMRKRRKGSNSHVGVRAFDLLIVGCAVVTIVGNQGYIFDSQFLILKRGLCE